MSNFPKELKEGTKNTHSAAENTALLDRFYVEW